MLSTAFIYIPIYELLIASTSQSKTQLWSVRIAVR